MFEEISILNRFLTRLNIEYEDVSYFLPIEKTNGEKAQFQNNYQKFS